ncbi:MAG: hypothetical protein KJZ84_18085 [Bryobacteraceae bacterium]|nr:hypothetical protein [Bryobacteraceae bacterium]
MPTSSQFPPDLVTAPQWCCWNIGTDKQGRPTKLPFRPDGRKASSNNSATWASFEDAARAFDADPQSFLGLGFFFAPNDSFCGIDLDASLDEDGHPLPWAEEVISRFRDTYAALSVSGRGLHILCNAKLPDRGRNYYVPGAPASPEGKRAQIGVFDKERFFALTGQPYGMGPLVIRDHQDDVDWLLSQMVKPTKRKVGSMPSSNHVPPGLADDELLHRARQAKNGPKFAALWDGDWQGAYGSHSEADAALCAMLAFWCGPDEARIDAMFRRSGLCRDKWIDREDYRNSTINGALEQTTEYYRPSAKQPPPANRPPAKSRRNPEEQPRIWIGARQLYEMTSDALAALQRANVPPVLFARSGQIVAVVQDEQGRTILSPVSEHALRGRMARSGFYYKLNKAKEEVECSPPLDVVRDILALSADKWKFPAIEGLIESPFLKPDGRVCTKPGYDADTYLFYSPAPGFRPQQVPDQPMIDDVHAALDLIESAIGDFPFADDSCRANALASLLTPVVRPAINGPTPLALFDAPAPGTGKTLLAEVVSAIATGRAAESFTAPTDPEEWRKKLTMALSTGVRVVVIDNVSRALDSDSLCQVITANTISDRQFRTFDQLVLPVRCAWIATGNNIQLGGDMPRRCYRIRLDAGVSRPFQRTGFRHANLHGWVAEHRGALIAALLTIARYWFIQGKPAPAIIKPLGSFESWCHVVGGMLEAAGVEGFLGNIDEMFREADAESLQWEAFLLALDGIFMGHSFKVTDVVDKLSTRHPQPITDAANVLRPVLPDFLAEAADRTDGFLQRRLGFAFAARVGRRFGESQVHVERSEQDLKSKVARWRVVR